MNNYIGNQDSHQLASLQINSIGTTGYFQPKGQFLSARNKKPQSNSLQNPIKIEDYSRKDDKNNSIIGDAIEENQEILDCDDEESFSKNRKDFLLNLKTYEAIKENPLDISKNKANDSQNFAINTKKNYIISTKNEKLLSNPKNFLAKTLDIKSACSSSPNSNSFFKNNMTATPKKTKITINTKKLTRPSFAMKPQQGNNKDNKEKYAKIIQKNVRKWRTNHMKSRFYKILFHSPSYEIKALERSPIKKSRILDNSTMEKNVKGSLLIVYYRKKNEVRVAFKVLAVKKIYYHIFDFSLMIQLEEALKVKVMMEFFKEMVKSFCIYYDDILMISMIFFNFTEISKFLNFLILQFF